MEAETRFAELERIRAKLGLSRVAFARALAVAPGTVSRWARGMEPSATVVRLAQLVERAHDTLAACSS